MGDAGEGLIDAEARLQERMDELEEARKVAKDRGPKVDPEHVRAVESLRLAKVELQRQLETTTHATRKDQRRLATRDRRPAAPLRRCRCGKDGAEPRRDRRVEVLHIDILHRRTAL